MAIILGLVLLYVAFRFMGGIFRTLAYVVGGIVVCTLGMALTQMLFQLGFETLLIAHRFLVYAGTHRLELALSVVAFAGLIAMVIALRSFVMYAVRSGVRAPRSPQERLNAAVDALRRTNAPVSLNALATRADVDRESALSWMSENPTLGMPRL